MKTQTDKNTKKMNPLRQSVEIRTTLYELVETVIDVVGTDRNQLIMPVLLNTLKKGNANVVVSGKISN